MGATGATGPAGSTGIGATGDTGIGVTGPTGPGVIDLSPVITSISPSSGSALGGTEVTIEGINFQKGAVVSFGGKIALSSRFNENGSITAISPAWEGVIVLTVATTSGNSTINENALFTYIPTPPRCLKGCFKELKGHHRVVVLKWRHPLSSQIGAYKIYRDAALTQLIGTVPADKKPLRFIDKHPRKGSNTYYVVAIDKYETASTPASIRVR